MPMRTLLLGLMLSVAAGTASASEFHVISRHVDGVFYASHRVFTQSAQGLYEVTLCGRHYWTRARTVAWMRWEVEQGREVALEFNDGNGWRRACLDPQRQVNLKDLGIETDYVTVMRLKDGELQYQQRFQALKRAFSDYDNSGEATATYHAIK